MAENRRRNRWWLRWLTGSEQLTKPLTRSRETSRICSSRTEVARNSSAKLGRKQRVARDRGIARKGIAGRHTRSIGDIRKNGSPQSKGNREPARKHLAR